MISDESEVQDDDDVIFIAIEKENTQTETETVNVIKPELEDVIRKIVIGTISQYAQEIKKQCNALKLAQNSTSKNLSSGSSEYILPTKEVRSVGTQFPSPSKRVVQKQSRHNNRFSKPSTSVAKRSFLTSTSTSSSPLLQSSAVSATSQSISTKEIIRLNSCIQSGSPIFGPIWKLQQTRRNQPQFKLQQDAQLKTSTANSGSQMNKNEMTLITNPNGRIFRRVVVQYSMGDNINILKRKQTESAFAKDSIPFPATCSEHLENKLVPRKIRVNNINDKIFITLNVNDMYFNNTKAAKYEVYVYQMTLSPLNVESWRSLGYVEADLLPMGLSFEQLENGLCYFAVRIVDVHGRCSRFSYPDTWE